MQKICIIGCGTYGSYLLKRLLETNSNAQITIIELGNAQITNENTAGLLSNTTKWQGASLGRYFGLGGTSDRWGGQLLFFDHRDQVDNNPIWQKIIDLNQKYQFTVLENLLDKNISKNIDFDTKTDIKTGVWLKYGKRNIYKQIPKKQLDNVKIIKNQRVVDLVYDGTRIKKLICINTQKEIFEYQADTFYLTAGALESCRLLMSFYEKNNIKTDPALGKNLGDHISTELFTIHHQPAQINSFDMTPRFYQGSLITKRIIIKTSTGRVGFAHAVFNKEVKAFTILKNLLFGKKKTEIQLSDIINGLVFLVKFGFKMLFLKKMHYDSGSWSVYLDMEQAYPNQNYISLSSQQDAFAQNGINVAWQINANDQNEIAEAKAQLAKYFRNNGLKINEVYQENLHEGNKVEDTYHPVGFITIGQSLTENYNVKGFDNLFHFSTAMLPSAKSINPTASIFCLVEDHLATKN
jgi:hypothetical protein